MIEIDIGHNIAEGRKSKGLSQAQFAKLLFVSKQAVGKWERNESLPDLYLLADIGKIIGVTDLNYFLGKDVKFCKCGENCSCDDICSC